MKLLLDACVLFPTVMREILLGVAGEGLFQPLWSDRILEEWARAARKIGPLGEPQARSEIALLRANWPKSCVPVASGVEARLWLPDPADVHVLAAAIAGSADAIVTLNASDFPKHTLAEEGLDRRTPDEVLMQFWLDHPDAVERAVSRVRVQAERIDGTPWDTRKLLKRARLPRLGKALG